MPLFVDDVEREVTAEHGVFPHELLRILQDIQAAGRYVERIIVNGNELALADLSSCDLMLHDKVEVTTYSLDELVEDTMQSARVYTPNLLNSLAEAVRLLRIGNVGEAAGVFSEAVRGLQWTYDVLRDLSNLHPGPSPVHEVFQESELVIPQLSDAWERQDYVLVADAIEYELVPLLEKWGYITEVFSSQIQTERLKRGMHLED